MQIVHPIIETKVAQTRTLQFHLRFVFIEMSRQDENSAQSPIARISTSWNLASARLDSQLPASTTVAMTATMIVRRFLTYLSG